MYLPAAAAAPSEPRGLKGKEPDTFDGSNRDLYPAFVLQLTLLFCSNPHKYGDDISKIRETFQCAEAPETDTRFPTTD